MRGAARAAGAFAVYARQLARRRPGPRPAPQSSGSRREVIADHPGGARDGRTVAVLMASRREVLGRVTM